MKKIYVSIGLVSVAALVLQNLVGSDLLASEQTKWESSEVILDHSTEGVTTVDSVSETSQVIEVPVELNTSTVMTEETLPLETIEVSSKEIEVTEATTSASTESIIATETSSEETVSTTTVEDSSMSETEITQDTVTDSSTELSMETSTSQSSTSVDSLSSDQSETSRTSVEVKVEDSSATKESTSESIKDKPAVKKPETSVKPKIELPKLSEIIFDSGALVTNLSDSLRISQIGKDNLSGFELPLLTSFNHVNQGAFIYELIQSIGRPTEKQSLEKYLTTLSEQVFTIELSKQESVTIPATEALAGDILFLKVKDSYQLKGVYLGQGFYVTLEESEKNQVVPKVQRISFFAEEMIQVKRIYQANLTAYGKENLADYPASMPFKANVVTQRFVEQVGEDARSLGQEFDVFASVMIAQAILESGGGTSQLASGPYYNLFGIKGSYQGQSVTFSTQEDRGDGSLFEIKSAFRKYPNAAASLSDYVQLIREGITHNDHYYEEAWRSNAKSYLRATHSLTGKYATDTTYHKKLNSIIAAYNLTQYDTSNDLPIGQFMQNLAEVPVAYRDLMTLPVYDGKDYNHSGSYPIGECTWYAYNRVAQLGLSVDDFMGNGGEWGESGRRLGYQVSTTPKVGTLISFKPGTAGSDPRYGHVAFVEAIGPEGILISEGNVYEGVSVSYRVIAMDLAYSDAVTYITPKR